MGVVKGGDSCNKSVGGGSCGTMKSSGGGGCYKSTGGKKNGCGTYGGDKHKMGGTYSTMKQGGSDCHCGPKTKKSRKSKKKGGKRGCGSYGGEIPEDEDKPLTDAEQEEMDKELNIGEIKRQDGGKKRKSKRKTKTAKKVKRKTAKKSFLARLFKL